jgi:hypothetical protein
MKEGKADQERQLSSELNPYIYIYTGCSVGEKYAAS